MIDENNLLNFHCNGIYDNTKSLTETEIIMKVLEKLNLVILNFNDLENKVLNNVKELDKQVNYYLDTGIKLEVNKQLDDNGKIVDINTKVSTNANNIENINSQLDKITNKMVIKDLLGDGTTLTTDVIKNEFTLSTSELKSNYVAVFSITAHWQARNRNDFGGYLLFVTKMPSGVYKMLTLATNSTNGFSAIPTIDDSGVLSIPSVNYYRYTIQRIDNMKTT